MINADSLQVYRHMDIGTAKPDRLLRERLPHHLIDAVEPSYQFNVGEFVKSAEAIAAEIRARGRLPLVCGGTAFYITSFLYGLPESPVADPAARARLKELARTWGPQTLARLLRERDPGAADRIPPGDTYRITRALEVLETTGESIFSFRWPRTPRRDFRFLLLGLQRDREELYQRIEARVDGMFSAGLVEEVKHLLAMGYGPGDPGMRGIGYREILATRLGCLTLEGARRLIKRNSRRYAKRQLTFFHSVEDVRWFGPSDVPRIRAAVEEFLAPLDHDCTNSHSVPTM